MAQQTKDIVLQWFQEGDYPTEQQFRDFFDSIFWKGQAGVRDIVGLVEALQNKAGKGEVDAFIQGDRVVYNDNGFYDIPEGFLLEKIIVLPGMDANIQIGSYEFGDDIAVAMPMSATYGEVQVLNLYAKTTRRIYFSGLPANSAIIFFKRKVKTA
ncbi:MAG TPA: hypothetical protein VD794_03070 [Flavisolibacter sp.]|nr:hypothetical protein [Flavisolibacter sp.]